MLIETLLRGLWKQRPRRDASRHSSPLPELTLVGDLSAAPDYERLISDLQRDHERVVNGRGTDDDRRVPALCQLAEARLAHCLMDDDYLQRLRASYLPDGQVPRGSRS